MDRAYAAIKENFQGRSPITHAELSGLQQPPLIWRVSRWQYHHGEQDVEEGALRQDGGQGFGTKLSFSVKWTCLLTVRVSCHKDEGIENFKYLYKNLKT